MNRRRKARPYKRPGFGAAVGEIKLGGPSAEREEFPTLEYAHVPSIRYSGSPEYSPVYGPRASLGYSPQAPSLEMPVYTLESPGYAPEPPGYSDTPGYFPVGPVCSDFSPEIRGYAPQYVEVPGYVPSADESPITPQTGVSEIVGPIHVPSAIGPVQARNVSVESDPVSPEYSRRRINLIANGPRWLPSTRIFMVLSQSLSVR
ncbi:hypothetical protein R1sor_005880 [Riccia sorocarpa]|uniref:Uncharacterized protein n=1 Tax=Riccia sorocarpa TaxID=122646 RepID=A0ABD3HP85_9MARC